MFFFLTQKYGTLHEFACHPCAGAIAKLLCIAPILVYVLPKRALHMYLFIYYVYVLSCFSRVQLFATPWTVAHQAPLPMGFSRQESESRLPCSPPEESSQPRDRNQVSHTAGTFFTNWAAREAPLVLIHSYGITNKESQCGQDTQQRQLEWKPWKYKFLDPQKI